MVRGVEAPRGVDFAALGWPVNVIMIEYISSATDATIISVCLGLLAGVVAFIAWYKLRRADMDMEHQLVRTFISKNHPFPSIAIQRRCI